ncbi:MAG TPA: dihydromethanopterin reductase (acceptor), partial [Methanosarcinales archaeon]|nr:dihydromethanopterin reductase (acceptor) [Methanosarcinales archaeon]
MNIAWGITGAGHLLKDSYKVFKELSKKDFNINTFVSLAGEEVLKMYGLFNKLHKISNGEYMQEIILEREQGKSFPKTGRFSLGKYDALIVTPTTSNTVAKIVHGIADTLITNAVAQAVKGDVPVYIVPVDIAGTTLSEMPYLINRSSCKNCDICPPSENCPERAIKQKNKKYQIDLLKCTGCGICLKWCEYGAISGGMVKLKVRDLDAKNVQILSNLDGITVLESPEEVYKYI